MKSLYNFIIKPYKSRYENSIEIEDINFIVNSNIENHEFISKKAVVVNTPAAFETNIKCGDIIYVHHNIFRRYYDIKGKEKNSGNYFTGNLYFCALDQIYMYNNKCNLNYCFVKPIKNNSYLSASKEKKHFGILKYSNSSLERLGLKTGDLVVFTPNSEFEFIIEGERLYCMKSNDIAVTHEYEGNEKENNPSWAKSH